MYMVLAFMLGMNFSLAQRGVEGAYYREAKAIGAISMRRKCILVYQFFRYFL